MKSCCCCLPVSVICNSVLVGGEWAANPSHPVSSLLPCFVAAQITGLTTWRLQVGTWRAEAIQDPKNQGVGWPSCANPLEDESKFTIKSVAEAPNVESEFWTVTLEDATVHTNLKITKFWGSCQNYYFFKFFCSFQKSINRTTIQVTLIKTLTFTIIQFKDLLLETSLQRRLFPKTNIISQPEVNIC
jgi:hypothetical protein